MTPDPAEQNVVRQQLARFASKCRLFAPLYRQVTLAGLRQILGTGGLSLGRGLAYDDVRDAWAAYLRHDNEGRGVVLIGHSQGSYVLMELIRREIDGKPIQSRLVSAILLGATVVVPRGRDVGGTFQHVPVCRTAAQTGCVVTYSTYRSTAPPPENALFGRVTDAGLRLYHSMYQLFTFAMLLVLTTNNLGVMWVAMEAATLTTVLLVALYRTHASLEAAWKYFILCGVGIAQALFGTILVYFAAERALGAGAEARRGQIGDHPADVALLRRVVVRAGVIARHRHRPAALARLEGADLDFPRGAELLDLGIRHAVVVHVVDEVVAAVREGRDLGPHAPLGVIEQIDVEGAEGAEGEFVFEDDRRPATDSEIETGIRRMRYARADLLELVDSVSDYVMDWRPPLTAMMRIDSWKPQPLTIREIVSDITGAEGYYMRGLRAGREPAAGSLNEYDLRSGQSALFDRLRSLSEDERGRVYRPIRPWQQAPELWTARKVIRRVISHERFHTAEIRQRIAWIHVGVPDFGAP